MVLRYVRHGLLVILVAIGLVACGAPAGSEGTEGGEQGDASAAGSDAALDDDVAIANYSIGFTMADNLVSNFSASVDEEAFIRGVQDRFAGRERAVSMEASRAALAAVAEQQRAAVAAQGEENLAAGKAFLAENAKREGVTQLPSGLQYEVLVTGEGNTPGPTDMVTTHYHGTLIDGTVFDSSYERGEPASFPVNGVIQGWTEALQLMPVGSKWRLYIPPDLAYGAQERGPIPPNSTLIFDVELLGIEGDESSDADAADAGSDDAS